MSTDNNKENDDSRLHRWRMILGGGEADGTGVELLGADLAIDNALRALPETIGDLRSLRILDLRNNLLGRLPVSLGRLANLGFLDLRNNRFSELPDNLADLPRLEKLDLRWNRLRHTPAWLDELERRGCAVLL